MYGFPRLVPNGAQWNQRAPNYPLRGRPNHGPRAPFRPRHQGFHNNRMPMHGGSQEHWCETCDRGFPSEDLLHNHKQQHQKCNIDGCQFIAHPKVITKHIQMQHSSGIYKKISKLNNPEEIEKWREERRKKYPTKNNIDKKAAELKEKIERGEKMGLERREWGNKRHENKHNRDPTILGQGIKRSHNNNNQPESSFRKPNRKSAKKPKILPITEENRSLAPFTGIQCLEMETLDSEEEVDEIIVSNDLIEDDAIETFDKTSKNDKANADIEEPVVCGALSSLMCEYGSSEDENDDVKEKQIKAAKVCETSTVSQDKMKSIENTKDLLLDKHTSIGVTTSNNRRNVHNSEELKDSNGLEKNIPKIAGCANVHLKPSNNEHSIDKKKTLDTKEDGPEEVKILKNQHKEMIIDNNPSINKEVKLDLNETNCENIHEKDDSGPEEIQVSKKDEMVDISGKDNANAKTKIVNKKLQVIKRNPVYRKPKPKVPSTLIYRLLSKEMKQERNKVLQCIRYIRKNNYFDKNP